MAANVIAGGYECNFLTEPDDALKCLICLAVAKDPRQHEECGRLFCNGCIMEYGRENPCPNCKTTGAQFYKDHKSKRDINELRVSCDNTDRQCEWVGTIGTLEEHMATCEFTLLPCPKLCEDYNNEIKHFVRRDIDEHLQKCPNRDYKCIYCGEEGTYALITKDHDKICPKKILPCPNAQEGCTDIVHRQRIQDHLTTECKCIVIPCKYKILGCSTELKRKDMVAHEEDDKLHLRMAIDMTVKLENRTVKLERHLEDKTAKLERVLSTLKSGEPIRLKLTDYQKRKDDNERVISPSYYVSPNGYHMALGVDANGNSVGEGTHVSVFVNVIKGRYDDELKWPFSGKITFTLLNQLEDKNHFAMAIKPDLHTDVRPGDMKGYHKFTPHSELGYNLEKNTQYLKDDTLYFTMSVEVADHKPWLE